MPPILYLDAGMEELQSREEQVACDAAYGTERRIGRLAPFGWEVKAEAPRLREEEAPSEVEAKMDVEEREAMLDADAVEPGVVSAATVVNSAKSIWTWRKCRPRATFSRTTIRRMLPRSRLR